MKKTAVLYVLATMLVTSGVAQDFKVKLSAGEKEKKILFSIGNSQVTIEGYDGDEINIQAPGYQAKDNTATSEGLKALEPSSKADNSGIGLSVLKTKDGVQIIKVTGESTVYRIKIPRQVSISYKEVGLESGRITISGLNGAIDVQGSTSNIDLSDVTGPVVANSTAGGDIKVIYANALQLKNNAITSAGGIVDVTLPQRAKVTFKLKPVAGKVYTNFSIVMKDDTDLAMLQNNPQNNPQSDNNEDFAKWIDDGERMEGTINGGGTEVVLLGVDIYIRKKK